MLMMVSRLDLGSRVLVGAVERSRRDLDLRRRVLLL